MESKFKRIKLKIRPALLEKLLFECMSGHAPSRQDVSEKCNVCTATSGKAVKALVDSGFMCKRIFSKNEQRPCSHLLFNDISSILLIDLSSSVYRMSVVHPNGSFLFSEKYIYDSSISFDDNLNIFISRNGLKLKRSRLEFTAISVLFSDENKRQSKVRVAHIPSIHLSSYIDSVIFTILGRRTATHFTVSSSISEAIKFRAIDLDLQKGGISSVYIGNEISAFHVFENGSAILCNPENILSRDELNDIQNIRLINKERSDALFIKLCDFMDSAFSPSIFLIDSDIAPPDAKTADKIACKFSLTDRATPIIYTRDNNFPLSYLGAARKTIFETAQKYITTNIK